MAEKRYLAQKGEKNQRKKKLANVDIPFDK